MVGYAQDGEFKYAFASHSKHITFHNMVMYCYPELHANFKGTFEKVTFQKSCINIMVLDKFSFNDFEKFIQASAAYQYPSELQLKRRKKS